MKSSLPVVEETILLSRIIKSTLAQTVEENKKVISLKKLTPTNEVSQKEDILMGQTSLRRDQIIEQATNEAERIIQIGRAHV